MVSRTALPLLGLLLLVTLQYLPGHLMAAQNTLYVPQQYSTIQEAVDAANPGDTIIVSASGSPYAGNITVEKSLRIIGASAASTIVNASYVGPGFLINDTSDVEISGFTITKSSTYNGVEIDSTSNVVVSGNIIISTIGAPGNGTFIADSNLVTVRNNTIFGNIYGVSVQGGFGNVVQSNTVTLNSAAGVYLGNTTGTRVVDNIMTRSQSGLDLWAGADGNLVFRNRVANNTIAGVWMISASNNQVVNNDVEWNNSTNTKGFYLQSTSGNVFYYNNIRHNSTPMYGVFDGDMSGNTWNDVSSTPRGNFWSNYNGIDNDNDGVGDTQLPWPCPNPTASGSVCSSRDVAGVDNYPLMSAVKPSVLNLTLTASPLTGCAAPTPLAVSFNSTVNGGFSPYQYSWNFGDSTGPGTNATTLSHSYTTRGQLFATLTVSDSSVPANVAFDSVAIDSFTGGFTLHVKDSFGGGPVAGANVSSTSQPPGVVRVSHVTNSSGIAAFPCLPPGSYKFEISRAGYIGQSTSVTVSGKTVDETINVSSTVPWALIEYAGIAAGIAIVVLATVVLIRRRKRSPMTGLSQKK